MKRPIYTVATLLIFFFQSQSQTVQKWTFVNPATEAQASQGGDFGLILNDYSGAQGGYTPRFGVIDGYLYPNATNTAVGTNVGIVLDSTTLNRSTKGGMRFELQVVQIGSVGTVGESQILMYTRMATNDDNVSGGGYRARIEHVSGSTYSAVLQHIDFWTPINTTNLTSVVQFTMVVFDTLRLDAKNDGPGTIVFSRNSEVLLTTANLTSVPANNTNFRVGMRSKMQNTGWRFDNWKIDTLPTPAVASFDTVAPIIRTFTNSPLNPDTSHFISFTISIYDTLSPTTGLDSTRVDTGSTPVKFFGIRHGTTKDTTFSTHAVRMAAGSRTATLWTRDDSGKIRTQTITYTVGVQGAGGGGAPPGFRVVGYYPGWNFAWYPVSAVPFKEVNTLVHFGMGVESSSSPFFDTTFSDYTGGNFNNIALLVNAVHAAGSKVLISANVVTAYGGSIASTIRPIWNDSVLSETFCTSLAGYAQRRGYDGIEFNFEWPSDGDRAGYSRLMRIMRRKLNAWPIRGILGHTIYVLMGNSSGSYGAYELSSVDTSADFHFMECYTLQADQSNRRLGYTFALNNSVFGDGDSWDAAGGYYDAISMLDRNHNTDIGYNTGPAGAITQGWSRSKIIPGIGFGFYLRTSSSPLLIGGTNVGSGGNYFWFNMGDVYTTNASEGQVGAWGNQSEYWDDDAGMHFKLFQSGGQYNFVSYEDSLSISLKTRSAIDSGYGGIGIYEIGAGYLRSFYPSLNNQFSPNPSLSAITVAIGDQDVITPPAPPVLLLPAANDTMINPVSMLFRWRNVIATPSSGGGDNFRLQVALDNSFSFLIVNTIVPDTFLVLQGTLSAETQYYWRVSSISTVAGEGSFSASRIFKTLDPTPVVTLGPAIHSSPTNGGTLSGNSFTVAWTDTNFGHITPPYTPTYRIQVDDDPAYGSPLVNTTTNITSFFSLISQPSTTYYWRVQVIYGTVTSAFTVSWTFITPTPPPPSGDTLPTNPYANNVVVTAEGGKFRLSPNDKPTLDAIISDATLLSWPNPPSGYLYSGTYSWKNSVGQLIPKSAAGTPGLPEHSHSLTSTEITGVLPASKGGLQYDLNIPGSERYFLRRNHLNDPATPYVLDLIQLVDLPPGTVTTLGAGSNGKVPVSNSNGTVTWVDTTGWKSDGGGGTNLSDALPDTARANIVISNAGGDLRMDSSEISFIFAGSEQGEITSQSGVLNIRKANGSGNLVIDHAANNSGFSINNSGGGGGRDSIVVYMGALDVKSPALWVETNTTGDNPQLRVYQVRVTTTDATATTIYQHVNPASNTTRITVYAVCRRTGGSSGTAEDGGAFTYVGVFKNVAGTATQIGATTSMHADIESVDYGAGNAIEFNETGSAIQVQVKGATTTNLTWIADIFIEDVGS